MRVKRHRGKLYVTVDLNGTSPGAGAKRPGEISGGKKLAKFDRIKKLRNAKCASCCLCGGCGR